MECEVRLSPRGRYPPVLASRIDILGVRVDAVSIDDVWPKINEWIQSGAREYVCVTGVHGVVESRHDPELRRIHNESGLTVPDGMPLVWSGRWAGAEGMERVYGPKMMLEVCRKAASNGIGSFLYGGREGVPEKLADRLRQEIPDLEIAGCHSPPFGPLGFEEEREVINLIEESGAEIVWVGLSTPKQERWMAEFREKVSGPRVFLGVGAAFDINAGLMPEAPEWVGQMGLQWLFRLVLEPRRLWRRYVGIIPAFLWGVLLERPHMVEEISISDR